MTMGARYVARVAVLLPAQLDPRFKGLSDRSAKVLLVMAGTVLDYQGKTAPPGHYFGGWHLLANTLGYPNATRGTPGQRAVARALRDLQDRGLVHHVGPAEKRPTARHVYALDL